MSSYAPGVIALAILTTTATADEPPPGTAKAPRTAPAVRQLFAGASSVDGGDWHTCGGTVTALGKGTITVAGQPYRIEQRDEKGKLVRAWVEPAGPPRTYTAIGPLAKGGFLKEGVAWAQYRLSDVKVGDKVFFDWRREGAVNEIHYVSIRRRPGGRVPPSPGEKADETDPWHERANAEQDFEEKGIPLPEKYRPVPHVPTGP